MTERKQACCGDHWTDRPDGHCDWTCCQHDPAEHFCADCPDRQTCSSGWPCEIVKRESV